MTLRSPHPPSHQADTLRTGPWRTAAVIAALLPIAGLLIAVAVLVASGAKEPSEATRLAENRQLLDFLATAIESGGRDGAEQRTLDLLRSPPDSVHARLDDAATGSPLGSAGRTVPGATYARHERILFAEDRPLRLVLESQVPEPSARAPVALAAVATGLAGAVVALLVGRHRARQSARRAQELANSLSLDLESLRVPARPQGEPPHDELEDLAGAARATLEGAARRLDELERQTREQQTILQSMGSGLLALDPEQRVMRVNRAATDMLAIDDDQVRGRLVQAVTRQPGLNRFLADALAANAPIEGEFPVDRDGRPRILVHAVSEPLRDAAGQPAGLLVSLSDVTTLRRLESLRADFAANVSHELRTPITNIKGYADTLLQVGVDDPDQTRRFLEIIRRNAQRLGTIIEDLLALARLEQPGEREDLEPVDVPVRQLVQAVREDLEIAAQGKSMRLLDQTPESLRVRAVPSLVHQALANLVSNAITYSPAGGEVRIAAQALPDGLVEIAVIDHGPGIAPHHLNRIFERFYRVDRARSRDQGGTGLGLAIVKHIALLHGGRVEVESRLGGGSTFRLVLPGTGHAGLPTTGPVAHQEGSHPRRAATGPLR